MKFKMILVLMTTVGFVSPSKDVEFLKNDLMGAIAQNNIEGLVSCLESAKAQGILDAVVNVKFDNGITPLMMAVYNRFESVVRYLLEYGAKPDIRSENDSTAFCLAIKKNDPNIIGVLLGYGKADPNFICNHEYPLSLAISRGNQEIIDILQERGAFIGPKTDVVDNPVFEIVQDYTDSYQDNEDVWNQIKFYLNQGLVDPAYITKTRNDQPVSLFTLLIRKNRRQLMNFFLRDMSYIVSDYELQVGLHRAQVWNRPEIAVMLEQEIEKRKSPWQKIREKVGF